MLKTRGLVSDSSRPPTECSCAHYSYLWPLFHIWKLCVGINWFLRALGFSGTPSEPQKRFGSLMWWKIIKFTKSSKMLTLLLRFFNDLHSKSNYLGKQINSWKKTSRQFLNVPAIQHYESNQIISSYQIRTTCLVWCTGSVHALHCIFFKCVFIILLYGAIAVFIFI